MRTRTLLQQTRRTPPPPWTTIGQRAETRFISPTPRTCPSSTWITLTAVRALCVLRLVSGVGSALGTTSYVVSEQAIDAVLANHNGRSGAWRSKAVPEVIAQVFPGTRYSTYPTPFLQVSATKSLVNPQLDYLWSLSFGLSCTLSRRACSRRQV